MNIRRCACASTPPGSGCDAYLAGTRRRRTARRARSDRRHRRHARSGAAAVRGAGFCRRPRVGAGFERAAGGPIAGAAPGRTRARCLRGAGRQDRRTAGAGRRRDRSSPRSTATRSASSGSPTTCTRLGREARLVHADLRAPPELVGRAALRCHPARCALLGDRSHPAPSGHQAAAARERYRRLRRPAARAAARLLATAPSRRPPAVCHLLGAAGRRIPGSSQAFGGPEPGVVERALPGPRRAPRPFGAAPTAGSCCRGRAGTASIMLALVRRGRPSLGTRVTIVRLLAATLLFAAAAVARRRPAGRRTRDSLGLRGAQPRRDHAVGARRLSAQRPARRHAQGRGDPEFRSGVHGQPPPPPVVRCRGGLAPPAQRAVLPGGHRPLSAAQYRRRHAGDLPDPGRGAGSASARSRSGRSRSIRSCRATRNGRSACGPACAAATCPTRCAR